MKDRTTLSSIRDKLCWEAREEFLKYIDNCRMKILKNDTEKQLEETLVTYYQYLSEDLPADTN